MVVKVKIFIIIMKTATALQLKTASSIWQSAVKSVSRLTGLLVRVIPLIVGSASTSWVKAATVYARFVVALVRKQGQRGAAVYLKACNLILLRAISGEPLPSTRDAGCAVAVSHGGLPRLIPANHRARIKGGDTSVIRFWLALFTLYRVLVFRGKLSIKTIITPGVEISEDLLWDWRDFVNEVFLRYLWDNFKISRFSTKLVYRSDRTGQIEDKPYPDEYAEFANPADRARSWWVIKELESKIRRLCILKSGPNSRGGVVSISNVILDALAWVSRPDLGCHLRALAHYTGCLHYFEGPVWKTAEENWAKIRNFRSEIQRGVRPNPFGKGAPVPAGPAEDLGKLGTREEPGKIRLFAMVDIFTQWVLSPLHLALFAILRRIPQDGTFNQVKPVKDLVERCKKKGQRQVYSYDLSAATDRLPVVLQEWLLSAFAGRAYAESWRAVLCDRSYVLPRLFTQTFGNKFRTVKYAVGQPMGALSSWAMLAITHHAIVQFAAYRAGWRSWFPDYAVLGDDVVIANNGVATKYVSIMKEIGVDIGFHKSIVSSNLSLEFAKRFFYKGEEVTPFPLVGAAVGLLGVSFMPEVIRACEGLTGKTTSIFRISKYMGAGLRASSAAGNRIFSKLPRKLRSLLILISHPSSVRPEGTLWSWLTCMSFGRKAFRSAEVKGRDSVQKALLDRIRVDFIPRIEKRVSLILSKFEINLNLPYPPQGRLKEECLAWWRDYIIEDLQASFDFKMGDIKLMISKISGSVMPSEKEINGLLGACDEVEKVAASLPVAVLSTKPKSPLKEAKVPSLVPLRVKAWHSLNKSMSAAPVKRKPNQKSYPH